MTSTVSAIITGYDYARFLPGAIESVLGQTVPPAEIIVVDDGSTDDTRAVVVGYAERGVRYVYKENGGAGSARNRGIRESSGTLLAFLDGDDRWLPNKLALQLDHLRRHPSCGLVTGSERQVYEEGSHPLDLHRKPVGAASFYPGILVENTIGNPSLALVRRECFERVGLFDETMRLGQDWDMWIRIARAYRIGVVDAPLILFTRHNDSLTAGKMTGRYSSNREIQRLYISQLRSPLARLRLKMSAQSMNMYYSAAALVDTPTERAEALRLAAGALALNPLYEAKNKAGVFIRAAFGRSAFDRLKQVIHIPSAL